MTLFLLSGDTAFPPAEMARHDGLLCIGGDLSPQRLIAAYKNGIFPWFSREDPMLWWSPDPRLVLYPKKIHISRSLRKKIRKNHFTITMDRVFEKVINACSDSRTNHGQETWLGEEMILAYIRLHEIGIAHSIEAWRNGILAGGLYGIALGGIFFGESMFSYSNDASKTALAALCAHLNTHGFDLIDCQITTPHLLSMGAMEIPRTTFLEQLKRSLEKTDYLGNWEFSGFKEK